MTPLLSLIPLSLALAQTASGQQSASAVSSAPAAPSNTITALAADRPTVELAICLDISGSMDGLIDSAKARLWSIVNDLATAKPVPTLKVALLTYGCDAYDPSTGWVVVDSPLTEDLDMISQKLFALRTNGGTELVGRVVNAAATQLPWGSDPNALRIIVVAGNESADQDQEVKFPLACKNSISRGILVNSIYCGDASHADAPLWAEVAKLADGQYICIDQSTGAAVPESPFDKQLADLSLQVNTTYLACGTAGLVAQERQQAQDANAGALGGGVAASRAVTKSGALYNNSQWDLVDGCAAGTLDLEKVKDEDLPEEMRGKTLEEKKAMVAAKQAERAKIQSEIQTLSAKREQWVSQKAAETATQQGRTLDDALKQAIRSQAKQRGMQFDETPAAATAPASGPAPVPQAPPAP